MQDWLGTRATADINLGAQIAILIGLWIGFYFARTGQITKHKNTQTSMVFSQLFFIIFMMGDSFYNYVIAGGTTGGTVARLMMVHGFFGLMAELSAIYLVLRMRTQLIPERFRVSNFKLMMRLTLALWTIIAAVGFATYYYRYLEPTDAIVAAPLTQLRQAGDDLVIHAVEMREAVARGNLETVKRHAEHLVNLIEGRSGDNYGDLDRDGSVEDPGDGTGLLNYLRDVERVTTERDIVELVEATRDSVGKVNADAISVIQARDLASVESLVRDVFTVADRANGERIIPLEAKAGEAGITSMAVSIPDVPGEKREPNTVTVIIDQFQFVNRTLTIEKGWTVVWINNESPKHTTTSDDDASFNSGTMSQGDTFSFTFEEAGEFPYYCRFHGDKGDVGMAGTIIVQ